jgi:cytochrome c551/c552
MVSILHEAHGLAWDFLSARGFTYGATLEKACLRCHFPTRHMASRRNFLTATGFTYGATLKKACLRCHFPARHMASRRN